MQRMTRNSMPALFVAILLMGALVLSACGSGNNPTPTAVATPLVENTATPLVENTPTTEVGTTETVTDTGAASPTETLTSSGEITATEEMTPSETMTATSEMTGTETMTSTESMTPMETVTATEEISPSATMTTTGNMTSTGSSVSSSSAMSDTGMLSGTMGVSGAEGMLIRASTLKNYKFVNQDGQVSGNIADYLVDVSTGNILFAFVEYGGLLDIGDKNLVMPLSAFRMGDGQLILNFNEQELKNFPDVGDNWPDVSKPDWDSAVSDFWRNLNISPGVPFTATTGANVMWLKDMTGYSLSDLGSGAGTIQDTLIDLSRSRIKYILFDFGTAKNQNPYIIPYSALDVQNIGNNQIAFNSHIDATTLQTAPRYDVNLYPNDQVLPESFSTEIDKYWADHGIPMEH